ncbi:MAG: hypothetical protein E6G67_04330 [Actinobacteria bacterium]|nr:MAG: hypothetical protein E6G67_04330 [Actinomycetota bacterium]
MNEPWFQDLESFEAVAQEKETRGVLLRMAALAHGGRLGTFIDAVDADSDLDEHTKAWLRELAHDETFLFAVERYLHSCHRLH